MAVARVLEPRDDSDGVEQDGRRVELADERGRARGIRARDQRHAIVGAVHHDPASRVGRDQFMDQCRFENVARYLVDDVNHGTLFVRTVGTFLCRGGTADQRDPIGGLKDSGETMQCGGLRVANVYRDQAPSHRRIPQPETLILYHSRSGHRPPPGNRAGELT